MIPRCKGARDLLPEDIEVFRYIEDVFRRSCMGWGYQEVRTPTLEYLHLFTAAGTLTPNMLSRVYSFLDWDGWSGERVVLRPDGTIPVARLYIENASRWGAARLFYVTNVFVFEATGVESRERWQCGAELIGGGQPSADVETIALAVEVLRNLGLRDVEIQLSHAGVLGALLKGLGLSTNDETRLLDRILDGDLEALQKLESFSSSRHEFLSRILSSKGTYAAFIKNLRSLPQLTESVSSTLDDFARVAELLDALGITYQIDVTSVRGFEYYTGVCFQFLFQGKRIGSGGRYNNLIPLIGGKNTPACGFALYMDPLMEIVVPAKKREGERKIMVRCEQESPSIVKAGFKLAEALRNQGYTAELSIFGSDIEAAYRWLVIVRDEPVSFVVVDKERKQEKKMESVEGVIDIIGGMR